MHMDSPDTAPDDHRRTQPHDNHEAAPEHQHVLHGAGSVIGVLCCALILAYLLVSFVFQTYQVDGPSMQTTLQNGDHLIVWKVPKTTARVSGHPYIPNRGDVIIFNETIEGVPEQLVKRVIGLPGEHITVKQSVVTVYNSHYPGGYHPDDSLPYGDVIKYTPGDTDVTLGNDEIFVMGDHRDNSRDSRDFGPIEPSQIVGKLVARVLPLNDFKRF